MIKCKIIMHAVGCGPRREQSTDRIDLMLVDEPSGQCLDFAIGFSNEFAHLSKHRPRGDRNCLVRGQDREKSSDIWATFGGDNYGFMDSNELPDAVRGVYIAPTFPGGEDNSSGWADWSGTSFATPVISALGAHLLAQGWSTPNALTRLAAGRERRRDHQDRGHSVRDAELPL